MLRRYWSRASRLYIVLSIVLAVLTGVVVHAALAQAGRATAGLAPTAPVVVASRPVARGGVVRAGALRQARFPVDYVPPGAFSRIEEASGRVALADLAPGEVVTKTRLARVRAGPVASLIPEGLRAFAVPSFLPPGAVEPGDHVDILGTFGAAGSGQPHTETVATDLEVLYVLGQAPAGSTSGGGGLAMDTEAAGIDNPITLILLIATEQEEALAFARAFANLEVVIAPQPST